MRKVPGWYGRALYGTWFVFLLTPHFLTLGAFANQSNEAESTLIEKPSGIDRERFFRSIGAFPTYKYSELKKGIRFKGSVAEVPNHFIRLHCNLEPSDGMFQLKQTFPTLKRLVSYVRENLDQCYEWLLPKGLDPSRVEWINGEYQMQPGDSVSEVLYAIGAVPLWEPWGSVRNSSSVRSILRNPNQVVTGTVLKLEKLPVIRKCNAVFEDSRRFHLAESLQRQCSLAQDLAKTSASKIHVVPSEVRLEANQQRKVDDHLTRSIASLGNSAEACKSESALTQIQSARVAEPKRVDLGLHEIVLLMKLGKSSEARHLAAEWVRKSPALSILPVVKDALAERQYPEAERCSGLTQVKTELPEASPDALPEGHSGGILLESTLLDVNHSGPKTSYVLAKNPSIYPFYAYPIEGNFANQKRYAVPFALTVSSGASVIKDQEVLNTDGKGLKRFFNIDFEVKDRNQCSTLMIIGKNLDVHYAEICFELTDTDLENLGLSNQAFYWRRRSGYWAQGGFGFVSQSVPGVQNSSSADTGTSLALRAGVGAWWKKIHGMIFHRRQVLTFSNKNYRPSWTTFLGGYSFELPKLGGFTSFLTPLVGAELYSNTVGTDQVRYLKSYTAGSVGLEARFVVGSRLEIGGMFLYGKATDLSSLFIQGDARYWLDSVQAVGLGTWWSSSSQSVIQFKEQNLAAEIYYRHIFSF